MGNPFLHSSMTCIEQYREEFKDAVGTLRQDIARLDELITALTEMVDAHTQRINEAGLEVDQIISLVASLQSTDRVLAERMGMEADVPADGRLLKDIFEEMFVEDESSQPE